MVNLNGRLPASALVEVEPDIYLSIETAAAWRAAKAAAAEDGVYMAIARPDGGYRTLATQLDMHRNPGAHNLNTASTVPLAAVGESSHGFGTCIDVTGKGAVTWILRRGDEFGIYRPSAADPNHCAYRGGYVAPPIRPIEGDEEEMSTVLMRGDSAAPVKAGSPLTAGSIVYLVDLDADEITRRWLPYEAIARAAKVTTVPQAMLDAIPKKVGSKDFDGHIVGPDGK